LVNIKLMNLDANLCPSASVSQIIELNYTPNLTTLVSRVNINENN